MAIAEDEDENYATISASDISYRMLDTGDAQIDVRPKSSQNMRRRRDERKTPSG